METRELLRYLEKLEIGLSSFSYEELGIVEAGELKKSFEIFRSDLEDKVFGTEEMNQLNDICGQMGISASVEADKNPIENGGGKPKNVEQLISLIASLEKTDLDPEQSTIVSTLRSRVKNLMAENNKPQAEVLESQLTSGKINLKPALKECMGQMELLEEAVKCYKRNIFEFIGSLKIQMDMENYDEIPVSCQKLLPSLKMMRASDLMQIVMQIETTSQTNQDIRYLGFLYDQFLAEFSCVDKIVDLELNALKNM